MLTIELQQDLDPHWKKEEVVGKGGVAFLVNVSSPKKPISVIVY